MIVSFLMNVGHDSTDDGGAVIAWACAPIGDEFENNEKLFLNAKQISGNLEEPTSRVDRNGKLIWEKMTRFSRRR